MSYLGNSTTFQTVAPGIDYFSGNASTTTFQLSRQIVAVQDILVYIDNVPQNPSTAYSINTATNQITFTSAPLSGTNNIWVYYNTKSIQFLVPSPGTVSNSSLNSGSFSNITGVGTLSSLTVTNDASISGLTVGKGGGATPYATAVGSGALAANTSGSGNSAFGYNALTLMTTGSQSTALGNYALSANTTGTENTGVGSAALYLNTTGNYNTSVGRGSLQNNTTASGNTAVGYQARYSNTTGEYSEGIGAYALYSNTTGTRNTAVGTSALYGNTTGNYNIAMGNGALQSNTTANQNTAVGYQAGYSNTTGTGGVFLGYQAGYTNTTGTQSVFVGYQSGYSTTGGFNTFVGAANSGYSVTTGSKNTILGAYSGNQGGLDIRTASNYIVLSDGDGNPRQYIDSAGSTWFNTASSTKPYNATSGTYANIGDSTYPILATSSSLVGILNRNTSTGVILEFKYNGTAYGSVSTNGSSVTYNTTSDYRLKEDIAPMTGALDKVAQLKPYTYTWKANGESSQGFIAHELAEIYPDVVTGEKDGVDEEGNPAYQAVDYSKLVATLTAAIQELKAEFDDYKATHP